MAVAVDNTLAELEEPLRTMRMKGLPYSYQPGELAQAYDVLFNDDGSASARNGYSRAVANMADITQATFDLQPIGLGYARGNTSRQIGLYTRDLGGTSNAWFYGCAATPQLLRTFGGSLPGGWCDFTSIGTLGLYGTSHTGPDAALGSQADNHLFLYGGMVTQAYSTGTVTVTRGFRSVVGVGTTFTASMVGGWLTDTGGTTLIGRIVSFTDATHVTLEKPALAALAGVAFKIIPVRNMMLRMAKGRITCSTGSAVVIGARTKFISGRNAELAQTWDLFRTHDYAFIGTVTSFDSDLQVTLVANSLVNMSNERYVAIPRAIPNALDSDTGNLAKNTFRTTLGGGWISEEHQGRLYMANRSSTNGRPTALAELWFSDDSDYEAFDLSEADGDWLIVGRSVGSITALASMQQGLAILKANELWMLYGDDPTNYQLRKIADVGTTDGRTLAHYGGSIIFASLTHGIVAFDGTTIHSLTEGTIAPESLATCLRFNIVQQNQMVACMADNIYLLSIFALFSTGLGPVVNGANRFNTSALTLALNVNSGALSAFTNMYMGCACQVPSDQGNNFQGGDSMFALVDNSADQKNNVFLASSMTSGGTGGGVVDGDRRVTNNDYWTTTGARGGTGFTVAGPRPYMQTRRINYGVDRLCYWKDVLLEYVSDDDTISVESVYGEAVDPTAKVESVFPAGGTLATSILTMASINKRLSVKHRSRYISLRFYPTTDGFSLAGGSTSWEIGRLVLLFRPMRRNRT